MNNLPKYISLASILLAGDIIRGQEEGPTYELESLKVYGSAASDAVARQRESDIIGSYLSSDALADLPDDNLESSSDLARRFAAWLEL